MSKNKRVILPGITLLCKPCIGARVSPHCSSILQNKEKQDHNTSWNIHLSMYKLCGVDGQSQRNHWSIWPEQMVNLRGFSGFSKRNTQSAGWRQSRQPRAYPSRKWSVMWKRIPSPWLLPVMQTRLSPRKREKNSKLKKAVSGLYILAPPYLPIDDQYFFLNCRYATFPITIWTKSSTNRYSTMSLWFEMIPAFPRIEKTTSEMQMISSPIK